MRKIPCYSALPWRLHARVHTIKLANGYGVPLSGLGLGRGRTDLG
jgi:hypothetical protein